MQTLKEVISNFEEKMLSERPCDFNKYDDYIVKHILNHVLEQLRDTINKLSDAAIKYVLYQSEYHKMLFYDILKTFTNDDSNFSFVSFVDYIMLLNYNIKSDSIEPESGLLLLKNAINKNPRSNEIA